MPGNNNDVAKKATTTLLAATATPTTSFSRRSIMTAFPSDPFPYNIIHCQQQQQRQTLHPHQSFQFGSSSSFRTTPNSNKKSHHHHKNNPQIGPYQQQFVTMATKSIGDVEVPVVQDSQLDTDELYFGYAAEKKGLSNLRQFWSTDTPERTTKFKQILLQGEISREDFRAIFCNAAGTRTSTDGYHSSQSKFCSHGIYPYPPTLSF